MLDQEKFEDFMNLIKQQEREAKEEVDYDEELQLDVKTQRSEIYRKFSKLCIEFKFLYVAITRPKRRLIIYDDDAEGRKPIQTYWQTLDTVNIINKEMIDQPEKLNSDILEIFQAGALQNEESTPEDWRIQGIKLFKKKYYDSAVTCFNFSGDKDLVKRCLAYKEADIGSEKQSEADSKVYRAKSLSYITKQEKKKMLKEAKKIRNGCYVHFNKAGSLFEQIEMY